MKRFLLCIAIACLLPLAALGQKTNITFLNPGMHTEAYWIMVSDFMQAAADDLGFSLEIIYCERDHMKQISLANEISKRSKKPDFVICVNEKLVAPQTIAPLDKAGIKTLLILNDLTDDQKKKEGIPRDKYRNWIGTIIPDNVAAGRLMAELLSTQARKLFSKINFISLNGVTATPAAAEREEGLTVYIKNNPDLKLLQIFNSDWTEAVGYEKTIGAFKRYPDINVIWCANDPLALGAIKAVKELGKIPGKDILISGLNWSTDAINLVKKGELATTVGGHFMCGGWALVLIKDYLSGKDFSSSSLEIKIPGFSSVDATNVESYISKLGSQKWGAIDFSLFAKSTNKALSSYDFSLKAVLSAMK